MQYHVYTKNEAFGTGTRTSTSKTTDKHMRQNMKILISTSDFLATDETRREIHSLYYLSKLPTTPGHINMWAETNYAPLNYCSKYH